MSFDVLSHSSHGVTYSRIGIERLMMFCRVPLVYRRKSLRNCREESHEDTNRDALHLVTEVLHDFTILNVHVSLKD